MKKIVLFAIAATLLVSCASPYIAHYAYDLRNYQAEGFLFSPLDYDKEYESIGMFETIIYEPKGPVYTSKDYLTEIMKNVKELGGNALMNLKIETMYGYSNKYGYYRLGVKVTGYAIKRLK